MLKSIPKSNISKRKFKVYKDWFQTNSDIPIIIARNSTGSFDENSPKDDGIYTHPLYNSTKTKYYTSDGNVFIQYGIVKNPGMFKTERNYSSMVYIIRVPQNKIGEGIKRGSVVLTDLDNGNEYIDDSFGNITTSGHVYNILSYDVETQVMVFMDANAVEYDITLSQFDVNTGIGIFTFNNDTDSYVVLQVDFQSGIIKFSEELDFNGLLIDSARIGNVFYTDGLIILPHTLSFTNYELKYKSTSTIFETEVLITINEGEFNISQNPSAIDVSLLNKYEFETTPISHSKPAGKVRILEVNDISKKLIFSGSIGNSIGTWDDYYESGSSDPTGSYIAPYITTIGLYDNNYDMIAVAKLPKAIKNLPDYSLNFIVRLDT